MASSTSSAIPSTSPEALNVSFLKRITAAEEYKCSGNDLYKANDIRGAVGKYHRALLYARSVNSNLQNGLLQSLSGMGFDRGETGHTASSLTSSGDMSPELKERLSTLEQGCYNNLAACLLLQDNPNYERVVTYCDNVLSVTPNNTKALYRKGCSLYNLECYEEAYNCLTKAQQISRSDPYIQKYLTLAKEKMADINRSQAQMYKGMFKTTATQSSG